MLDKDFWDNKYQNDNTGWDVGYIATPLKNYFDQLKDKSLRILIPGAGNAYEVEYLYSLGFKNVFLLDFAVIPINNFKERNPDFPENQIIYQDFFKHQGNYDLIIEHTFFTSLIPSLRKSYVQQIHKLLKKEGKFTGLLFDYNFKQNHPPYGGNKQEYISLFSPLFKINNLETAYNSIKPRKGRELFIQLQKL
jgi:thiopurine S-methyltransferase